jgi:hypothetical protein
MAERADRTDLLQTPLTPPWGVDHVNGNVPMCLFQKPALADEQKKSKSVLKDLAQAKSKQESLLKLLKNRGLHLRWSSERQTRLVQLQKSTF